MFQNKYYRLFAFIWNFLTATEIDDGFWKVIMQYDVTSCVICISKKLEYLNKES